MSNPWFRMYSEFSTDPKVQSMSEAMQRRLTMLLCMRCSDVTVTLCDEELAFALRISDEELVATKALFIKKGFIDEAWAIVNWDKRQFSSDSSAERTRSYRERKKSAENTADKSTAKLSETSLQRHSDALDTDTDTDTDTDKRNTAQAPSRPKIVPQPKPKPVSKETALPSDFEISERIWRWSQEKGYGEIDRHFEHFVSTCKAKGYTYVDWDEAFMGAVRKNWAQIEQRKNRGVCL